jgi:cytochrome c
MRKMLLVVAAAGMLVTGAGYAASGADVLKAKGCLGCHDIDKKKVGPAYKDIAAQFKGNKNAEAELTKVLRAGPPGHAIKVTISDADLKSALDYILSLK